MTVAHIVKRDGSREPISFDKILHRVVSSCNGTLPGADPVRVAQRVVQGVRDGVTTEALDALAADTAAALSSQHPDYSFLAARLCVVALHERTQPSVRAIVEFLSADVRAFAEAHLEALDAFLVWSRDFSYDYFGYKTLERSYLLRDACDVVVERPQVMLMRVALGIHCGDLPAVQETYDLLSRGVFTHATPTMFNAGTPHPTLASCFLLPVVEDSTEAIFDTLKRCALISKSAGGLGLSVSNVRCQGSLIRSTRGKSEGLCPMLRVFEATARYINQGGGKRRGALAAYLEPWHPDVLTFLDMKKNHGPPELRALDLFYGLWIPDLFMRRVEAEASWSLFCPSRCGDLQDLHGEEFDRRYEAYEAAGLATATVPASKVWTAILEAQVETGTPYMLYKDACNAKSNQSNLGTIRSSNLCTEVVQFSSADEVAVCNLASLALPAFVRSDGVFDHEALAHATRVLTRNLNRVIDRSEYALEEARRSNARHRPVGIGVQGLADVFALLHLPYDGPEAKTLNRHLFETIYFAAVSESCALARVDGPYETFATSPAARGHLQCDLWGEAPSSTRWDWSGLRKEVATHGLRNSLLVAPMPTASTAQILGNTECFEPFTSNLYVRRVLAGEFAVINKHLVRDLERHGLWNERVRTAIVAGGGSVQHVDEIPDEIKRVYRTAWEMSMRALIDLAADRGPFVCQSQSLNLFLTQPTRAKMTKMHFYAWRKGLKTGMYYLRTKAAAEAVKVTLPCESCSA